MLPHPRDVEFMVRRGWPPAHLMAMPPREFRWWLDQALAAARDEAEAVKAAA